MKFFGTMKNVDGILHIGGVSVETLAKDYKTPLYIMDTDLLVTNLVNYLEGFRSEKFGTTIVFASKAFLSKSICQILDKFGAHIDAVSGGELFIINEAKFPVDKIHMHGNNKSYEELEMCVNMGVGRVVIDHIQEAETLAEICKKFGKKMKVMLRVNNGIDAHTHEYIRTSKHSSKFGESIFDDSASKCIKKILDSNCFEFLGLHCHIGSQIFDTKAFYESIEIMIKQTKKFSEEFNIEIPEINLGGGIGVYYTADDEDMNFQKFLRGMIAHIEKVLEEENFSIKNISVEPGRSLVANAGSTLYTVGGTKKTFSGQKYVFIDGGMTDNIRTALYQAKYEATVANKLNEKSKEIVNIAGNCCESSDVILKDYELEKAEVGDLILTPTTGAYGYVMSSNYNGLVRPAVVFVSGGKAQVSIKRETFEDLTRNDLFIKF
ncbi:MAG: diaminopimelate decarboxylase [Fusobacteriaceae bacterium]